MGWAMQSDPCARAPDPFRYGVPLHEGNCGIVPTTRGYCARAQLGCHGLCAFPGAPRRSAGCRSRSSQTGNFCECRSARRITRRNQRVVGRQTPTFAIIGRRKVVGRRKVPPKHRPFDAALQAGDVFGVDATPDRHGWLKWSFLSLRLTKRSQRLVDLRNHRRYVARTNTVPSHIRGHDLCHVFFHEIAPPLFLLVIRPPRVADA